MFPVHLNKTNALFQSNSNCNEIVQRKLVIVNFYILLSVNLLQVLVSMMLVLSSVDENVSGLL